MTFPTLGLNPGIGKQGLSQSRSLIENMQFGVCCWYGERHPLSGMADGTAEFLDGMMCRQDIAMRVRRVGLLCALEAGTINAHMASLTTFYPHGAAH